MRSGLLILLVANIIGGCLSPLFVKLGTEQIPPIIFTFIRFVLASIILIPFLLRSKQSLSVDHIKKICLFSIFFALNATLYGIGLQYTSIIVSQVLYTLVPLFVGILAHFLINEKFTVNKIVGAVVSGIGVLVLILGSMDKVQSISFGTPIGNLLILGAVVCWSLYVILSRRLTSHTSPSVITFYSFAMTSAILSPIIPVNLFFQEFNFQNVTSIGYISLFGIALTSALMFYLIQIGIKKTSAYVASVFSYFAPLFAAFTAIPLLHEKVSANLVIAAVMITGGVFIATTLESLKKKKSK